MYNKPRRVHLALFSDTIWVEFVPTQQQFCCSWCNGKVVVYKAGGPERDPNPITAARLAFALLVAGVEVVKVLDGVRIQTPSTLVMIV